LEYPKAYKYGDRLFNMIQLTDKQIEEFFRHSYKAVDGLWFVKVEEKYGFDVALQIDEQVWKILPKIQARMLKSMSNLGAGIEALLECFTTKLFLEGFVFNIKNDDKGRSFTVIVERCPWHELMVKSGREKLSGKVGTCICNTEYQVWATEFDKNIRLEIIEQICMDAQFCKLKFSF
jgi:hypothetical protein